ncbi:MAG: AsmA-like C-terminal domain-containing protein, partial [Deltaproteobacteria bacterium]|nr:AsmA-like C-terminal domain-containing protein [Deltaproteobacteria bacterium]
DPLVTLDKILSNIPVVNWIITGKDKSTVTFYNKITGPLKSPEVRSANTEELTNQAIEAFEGIQSGVTETIKETSQGITSLPEKAAASIPKAITPKELTKHVGGAVDSIQSGTKKTIKGTVDTIKTLPGKVTGGSPAETPPQGTE